MCDNKIYEPVCRSKPLKVASEFKWLFLQFFEFSLLCHKCSYLISSFSFCLNLQISTFLN